MTRNPHTASQQGSRSGECGSWTTKSGSCPAIAARSPNWSFAVAAQTAGQAGTRDLVIDVLPGTPAELAGIEIGAEISAWDGKPLDEAKAAIILIHGRGASAYDIMELGFLLGGDRFLEAALEHFRGDGIRGVWFGGLLSTSQLISIAGALGAGYLLWRNRGRREPMPGVKQPGAAAAADASP